MGSKRGYLLMTGALVIISIGTGFAMQQQQDRKPQLQSALQSLEAAQLQLAKAETDDPSGQHGHTSALIDQAIRQIKAELSARKTR